ncbi:tetratricopeptide repeat-containing sulfotransferase family protein [Sphingobium nicotianae]|uniref:Sulfotransferase n=1 Tax=Sphingobium nicotianae TaxID=2782607 RepID=A0A9X1D9V0_9SPHN|nr:sulfotransferase [Sphingobium nicotianae]MBT2186036.1 sulfotransferase [Sphingobium nicotianae]
MIASATSSELRHVKDMVAHGQIQDGLAFCMTLAQRYPADPEPILLEGQVSLDAGLIDRARSAFERVLALKPESIDAVILLVTALVRSGDRQQALSIAAPLLVAIDKLTSDQLDSLGTILAFCDEADHALHLFRRAVESDDENPHKLFNLATVERMHGQLKAAEERLDKVIALTPDDAQAYYVRAELRRQTRERNHVPELEHHAAKFAGRSATLVNFALAKELEDIGEYARSFTALRRACDSERSRMRYDVDDDVRTIDQLIREHDELSIRGAEPGYPTREPIFVIGLPRSGTTLVERIIGSHSRVFDAGELNAFPASAIRMAGKLMNKSSFVTQSLRIAPAELGSAYIAATRPQTGGTERFTDKLPLNYLYAGLIARALPFAKIVALDRSPLDVCYAMYKTFFTGAYPFTYDLRDVARYYAAWTRLMAHWRLVLGDRLITVSYEHLVAEPEFTTRRLIASLDLKWEDQCLESHTRRDAVTTASATQVRRPINTSSVNRWQVYRDELKPLMDELRKLNVDCGD